MAPKQAEIETRIIAAVVDNEVGVLARVIGLFSGRGYNIASLTVTEVDPKQHLSRITVVTSGTPQVLEQIKAQLARLVPVHSVSDLTQEGPFVARELALVKVAGTGENPRRRELPVGGCRAAVAGPGWVRGRPCTRATPSSRLRRANRPLATPSLPGCTAIVAWRVRGSGKEPLIVRRAHHGVYLGEPLILSSSKGERLFTEQLSG